MTEPKRHYTILGTHPYATMDEIEAAFGNIDRTYQDAKANRATYLATRQGTAEFTAITAQYEDALEARTILKNPAQRKAYDNIYLPERAQVVLEVIQGLTAMTVNKDMTPDPQTGERSPLQIKTRNAMDDHNIQFNEIAMIIEKIKGIIPATNMAVIMDFFANKLPAIEVLSAMLDLRDELAGVNYGFDAAATTPPVRTAEIVDLGPRIAAAERNRVFAGGVQHILAQRVAIEEKRDQLTALAKLLIKKPSDADLQSRFFTEVESGAFSGHWLAALAIWNEEDSKRIGYGEYHQVLGLINAAIKRKPETALHPEFHQISQSVFNGLAYMPRSNTTHAMDLFRTILQTNPNAFTAQSFEHYSNRDIGSGEGGMLINVAIDLMKLRPDIATFALAGLANKLLAKPLGQDDEKVEIKELYAYMMCANAISGAWLTQLAIRNQADGRVASNHPEYRAVIELMTHGIYLKPQIALDIQFTKYMGGLGFDAVSYMKGGSDTHIGCDFLYAVARANPDAITPEALGAYCSYSFDKGGYVGKSMLIAPAVAIIRHQPHLATAALAGLKTKIFSGVDTKDREGAPVMDLYQAVWEAGAITHAWLDDVERANEDRPITGAGKGSDHRKLKELIDTTRPLIRERPPGPGGSGGPPAAPAT